MNQGSRLVVIVFAAVIAAAVTAAKAPLNVDSHVYADHVLYPRMVAAQDAFALQHDVGSKDHGMKLNVGDVARFNEVLKAQKEWADAMKAAGY